MSWLKNTVSGAISVTPPRIAAPQARLDDLLGLGELGAIVDALHLGLGSDHDGHRLARRAGDLDRSVR